MKHITLRLLPIAALAVAGLALTSCGDDDKSTWEQYKDWRQANIDFFEAEKYRITESGVNEYTPLTPAWNIGSQILVKYLSDRSKTEGNLSPLLTSTVKVKYIGRLYNNVAFDSSYLMTDSVLETSVGDVIAGWTTALQYMRVGDSARVVIPYSMAYGASGSGSIPPYSTLVFDMKLTDIVDYEAKP